MAVNVKLSEELVATARRMADVHHRSVPKQIEYWSMLGRVAEDNPDLPMALIKDILLAQSEDAHEEYEFGA